MRPLLTPCILALVVLALAGRGRAGDAPDPATTYSGDEAIRVGWPALAGPYGDFQPLRTAERIVDDLTNMTVAWESECADLGIAKQETAFGKSFQSGKKLRAGAKRKPGRQEPADDPSHPLDAHARQPALPRHDHALVELVL